MPNDAKLGLLAGVAGVVLAAVLYFQNPAPGPAVPPAAATLPATPVARVTPPRADPPPAEAPGVVPVAGRRAEVE
ncbi:MAG: hypothetical protein K2X87_31390, partial [Gemmataceae bacterium]|nr:hypothetical protein [Gemmataceae bacterium]